KSESQSEKKPARKRKVKPDAGSIGLTALECASEPLPAAHQALKQRIERDGGRVLSAYREPLSGNWVLLSALPIEKVEPTPYQRELSKTHAQRLSDVIMKVGRFLDPVVAVAAQENFITPNGMHRLTAMKALGAKAIIALVVPEPEVAYRILALNTEKAHTLRDKALEVVRMAHALAEDESTAERHETDLTLEFEEPSLLTLGLCYEQNGRFSGGAYRPVVSRCEEFRDAPLSETMPERKERADKLIELDALVNEAVKKLKEQGFTSGYLKPVVVARINPLRFVKQKPGEPTVADFDKTIGRMMEGARKFDASKVKAADIALAASMGSGSDDS
ncbi:MAG TPA: ParB N-terminal domain-containing protein, partial [Polyangiales bacterium]|nr:ParB N-terminal domain-containing protein [Polyangiales bacterium]